ncbi:MAG: hypothetical protein V2I56_19590 [Desulfobacteraceae bacterium]|nr:hypothetical protein [Desulfobacteraceae bacterium]
MTSRRYLIPAIILGLALFSLSARADVVVLKTGKKMEVEKVWQENGQIWIIFQGMRARIPQSKVERIESEAKRDPGNLKPPKAETADLKTVTRSTPRNSSRRQTASASQTAPAPRPAKIRNDPNQIFPDEKFGNLRWGSKISVIKGLEKLQDAEGPDGVVEYRRENENLKFGKAALSSIDYAFWRDRLYMLTIRTQGHSNYTALCSEVFRQFGKGRLADQAFERYLWTDAPNDMMLEYSKEGEQGLLWLRSCEIDRQYKLARISGHASYLKWMKSRN